MSWASGFVLPKSVPYGAESPFYSTPPIPRYYSRPVFQLTLNQHLNRSWRMAGWGKVRLGGTYQTVSNVVLGSGDGWIKTFALDEEFISSPSLPGHYGLWASKSGTFTPGAFKGENVSNTAGDLAGMWREWHCPGPLTTPNQLVGSGEYFDIGFNAIPFNAFSRLILTFEGRASTYRSGAYHHNVIKVTATEEVTTDISVDPEFFESLIYKDAGNTADFYLGGWSGQVGDIPTNPHNGLFAESEYYDMSGDWVMPPNNGGSVSFEFLNGQTESLELLTTQYTIPVLEGVGYAEVTAIQGINIYFEQPLEWSEPPPL